MQEETALLHTPHAKTKRDVLNYNPNLLTFIPRQPDREALGIAQSLPFDGVDIWNGYQLSWLNDKGKPQTAIIEFGLSCFAPYSIEADSLELYFNSFNQTHFASIEAVKKTIEMDLSDGIQSKVIVNLIPPYRFNSQKIGHFGGICLDDLDVEIETYEIQPAYLRSSTKACLESLYTQIFKCHHPMTGQPESGTVFIRYKGQQIEYEGLLKYLVSYRLDKSRQESCVERIYVDLLKCCQLEQLTVYVRFARQNGIDINPFRSNFEGFPENIRLAQQ